MRKEFKEMFSAEIISITGGLLAGTLLAIYTNRIEILPGLFILLPGFLEMRGNISGSLAARLGSAMHLGVMKPKFKLTKRLTQNIIASFTLSLIVGFLLGFVAMVVNYLVIKSFVVSLVYVSVVAAFLSNIILIPLTVITTFWLYAHKFDPDNIMGPYVTTIGDIVSIIALIISIGWLL